MISLLFTHRQRALLFICINLIFTCHVTAGDAPSDSWLRLFSSELGDLDDKRQMLQQDLDRLGSPIIGQTAPQFGYQHRRLSEPPLKPPFIQIDLGTSQVIDRIVLIPAVLEREVDKKRTYGFPLRFRVDVAEDKDFENLTTVANFTDNDVPDPGIAPLVMRVKQVVARFVRVTVTKLAEENAQHFFALSELMVLSGRRNVAINCEVSASASLNIPPRWVKENLVDNRTPLGPPIRLELLPWDGLFALAGNSDGFSFMAIDLGQSYNVQEVRLYATHARLGADIPGFSFPLRFVVESSLHADFSQPHILLDASQHDYPNPGDNAIIIPAHEMKAQHLRIRVPLSIKTRFSLSEIEVYAGDKNVARDKKVTSTPDPSTFSKNWPQSLLVDGFTSYGRLIELPEWMDQWEKRASLQRELSLLQQRRSEAVEQAEEIGWWTLGGMTVIFIGGIGGWLYISRRRREKELEKIRRQMARDMHDEIGSNLAAIARLSEVSKHAETTAEDWEEVQRIAQESMDGMREVLWLAGAREEAGPELAGQLRRLIERLLGGYNVSWRSPLESLPTNWSPATRRELFLFIKESLANIVHHAQTKQVEIAIIIADNNLIVEINDKGVGFNQDIVRHGVGLQSLHARADNLGGRLIITSQPGQGTKIQLTVPISKLS